MDLSYTDEQNMLRDSIQKWVDSNYELSARKQLVDSDLGYSADHWKTFAELGWLAMPFAEDQGGFGGDAVDVMLIMEEFGKGLVVEPFLATVVMFGMTVDRAGTEDQRSNTIPAIISGDLKGSFAYAEAQAHFDHFDIKTTATQDGDFYILDGTKSVVMNAGDADKLLVSARTSGGQKDENGITVFMVDTASEGVKVEAYPTVDGLRAGEVSFDKVKVSSSDIVGEADKGAAVITDIQNRTILALAAESVGAMEVLYQRTIDYTKQREQFGHPLSEFQVLKHKMTEMFVEHSLAKSLCMKATMLETQGSEETQRTVHALKYLIGKSGRFISQNAVQLHGGMGMTEELAIAHYFKRLMIVDAQFGNTDHHLEKFVA